MKKLFGFGVVALAAALVAPDANAQSLQVKCEQNAAKNVSKFAGAKVKCRSKCWATLRKGGATNCTPGSLDPATQACVTAAESKSNAGQQKKCGPDACPACYSGGDCVADSQAKTNNAENLVDTQDSGAVGSVHCNGGTQMPDQGKCQDNAGKVLTKFVAALSKCTSKCISNEAKGNIPAGSCSPPASDPATQACITAAKGKCEPALDKKCSGAGAVPDCWADGVNSGAEWCGLVQTIVNGQFNSFYCAPNSPSGAFLD